MKTTNLVAIVKARFAKSNDGTLTGNATGYNSAMEQIHLPADLLAEIGIEEGAEDSDLKAVIPFFAIISEREFNNDKTDATKGTFKQLRAGMLFKTKAEALTAYTADDMLANEGIALVKASAKASGLTADDLKRSTQASPFV
jgi:hypothetical protein